MQYALLPGRNPFWALGLEISLLQKAPLPPGGGLLVWTCAPCVALGHFQNPWAECAVPSLGTRGIFLARRPSGGGCVFLDEGNFNFSFLREGTNPRQKAQDNLELVAAFLRGLGYAVGTNERDDLVLDAPGGPHKISGSAFKQTKGRSLHHFSLLIDSNLETLAQVLRPSFTPSKDRSIPSTRSRVATLSQVTPHLSRDSLWPPFKDYLEARGLGPWPLNLQGLGVEEKSLELGDWEWVMGGTPAFSYEGEHLSFSAHRGMLTDISQGRHTFRPSSPLPLDAPSLEGSLGDWGGIEVPPNFWPKTIGATLDLNRRAPHLDR